MSEKRRDNFFKRLTKLFVGGPIVRRKVAGVDTRVAMPDPMQSSAAALFQKSTSPMYSAITANAYNHAERLMRYQDYDAMEQTPEIASALDIYADECVAQDEKGRSLHIFSENAKIKSILENLFYDTLNVEFNLRPWARSMCKFGDVALYNDVHPDFGVMNAVPIPINELERVEGYDRNNPMAVKFKWAGLANKELENWEVTHMRILGNDMFLPYGSSMIEAARRIWRQLILIEDAMLVYRIVRAPERRIFYVDIGNLEPEAVASYMEQQKAAIRTNSVVDKATGRQDMRYNPMAIDEDFWLPVRGNDTGTKIESLAGGQNTAAVEDVAYIQKKLFAALKVPKAYLGYEESLSSKASLAQEDIRFSRTISMLQRTIISELNKLAMIHLYAHGFDGEDLLDFTLRLSNPSTIAVQQKLELYRTKFEICQNIPEGLISKGYIRKNILMMSQDEIDEQDDEIAEEAAALAGESEEAPSGDLFGGTAGGEESASDEEPGADLETAGEDHEEDEDDDLDLLTDDESSTMPAGGLPINAKYTITDRARQGVQERKFRKARKLKPNEKKGKKKTRTIGTHMPDFAGMLDPTDKSRKHINDPNDISFLKSLVSNPFGESHEKLRQTIAEKNYVRPTLTRDVKMMLGGMSQKFESAGHTRAKLVTEGEYFEQGEYELDLGVNDENKLYRIREENGMQTSSDESNRNKELLKESEDKSAERKAV